MRFAAESDWAFDAGVISMRGAMGLLSVGLALVACGDEEDTTSTSTSGATTTTGSGAAGGAGGQGGGALGSAHVVVATSADKLFTMSLDRESGALSPLSEVEALGNPTFLAIDPAYRYLFAAHEGSDEVSSWSIDPSSRALSFLSRVPSQGGGPAYVSIDRAGAYLLVSNFGGGNVASIPIKDGGALTEDSFSVHTSCDKPHAIRMSPDVDSVYVPCLADDRVALYNYETTTGIISDPSVASNLNLPAGTGPRHLEFHPTLPYAYLVNETADSITVLERTPQGPLFEIHTVSTLPSGADAAANYCADIHVSVDGRSIYASNRGHDSIAIFSISEQNGTLTSVGHQPTGGSWPRNFALDPSGDLLLVANQMSDNIVSFRIDNATGLLTQLATTTVDGGPAFVGVIPNM